MTQETTIEAKPGGGLRPAEDFDRRGKEGEMDLPGSFAKRLMWVIWPAFLVAAVAEAIFFTIFDPFELHFFGATLDLSREAIYAMGFFGFWALGIASSGLTVFLERSPWEVNRCPLEPPQRPAGCPKREDLDCCGPA